MQQYFDYYETVIMVCRYPGCGWEHGACWEDLEQQPPQQFADHFVQAHASPVVCTVEDFYTKGTPQVTNDLYAQAFAGLVPGRELDMEDRYRLIRELNQLGYSDTWIAKHTQGTLSSITAARVRLGLPERDPREAW